MFILEAPLFLLLLLVIPTGIFFRHIVPRRGGQIPFSLRVWGGSAPRPPLQLRVLLAVSHAAFWLGIAGLIVALAGPGTAERRRVYLNRGIDIMLVVDVSPSMAIMDFGSDSRLTVTRNLLYDFTEERGNDAIGIVAFGRNAALRLSPTTDRDAVRNTMRELSIFDHGDGSAVGLGLSVAALHLEHSSAEHQAIVLVTDGSNNAGEVTPDAAAALINNAGIELYVVGIGSDTAAPIEFTYPETGTTYRGTMTDVYDLELLEEIAAAADGRVYTANSTGTLTAVLNEIDSLEVVERRIRIAVATEPLHRTLLLIAFGLLLIDFLIRKIVLREVI